MQLCRKNLLSKVQDCHFTPFFFLKIKIIRVGQEVGVCFSEAEKVFGPNQRPQSAN